MIADQPKSVATDMEILCLNDDDAPAMRDLAALTKPGPFYVSTHRLGGFVGIKDQGSLVAMAGERMKLDGFTEVSGVCTHPSYRGRGYAAALISHVCGEMQKRGDIPFLHSYAANGGANALYESLGFRLRSLVSLTRVGRSSDLADCP